MKEFNYKIVEYLNKLCYNHQLYIEVSEVNNGIMEEIPYFIKSISFNEDEMLYELHMFNGDTFKYKLERLQLNLKIINSTLLNSNDLNNSNEAKIVINEHLEDKCFAYKVLFFEFLYKNNIKVYIERDNEFISTEMDEPALYDQNYIHFEELNLSDYEYDFDVNAERNDLFYISESDFEDITSKTAILYQQYLEFRNIIKKLNDYLSIIINNDEYKVGIPGTFIINSKYEQ
jgi:hypothetical protein